jgi:hypothetical protein
MPELILGMAVEAGCTKRAAAARRECACTAPLYHLLDVPASVPAQHGAAVLVSYGPR